ncbi:MAG: hypothetical protein AB3N18_16575 [Allomuricauda sp.]
MTRRVDLSFSCGLEQESTRFLTLVRNDIPDLKLPFHTQNCHSALDAESTKTKDSFFQRDDNLMKE